MLAPWKKSCDQPRKHIKNHRHYFTDQGLHVKAKVFLSSHVLMWQLDNKESRIDAFELCCWRRYSGVPWTARRSNQLILKEISPEYSLEELMVKLKLLYFGHLMRRTDSLEKTHGLLSARLLCPQNFPGKNTGVGCHFLLQCRKVKSESEVVQSYPTLCDPMGCSLLGSSVHGISQAAAKKS